MIRITFVFLSFLTCTSAFAVDSHSAKMKIQAQAIVSEAKGNVLNLALMDGGVISLSCAGKTDVLEWSNLNELINNTPLSNFGVFPSVTADIHTLSREDFYCDTFYGKQDADVFQVYKRISGSVGKSVKIIADVFINVISDGQQRTEIVNVTALEFYDGNSLLASFTGRPAEREAQSFAAFSGLK